MSIDATDAHRIKRVSAPSDGTKRNEFNDYQMKINYINKFSRIEMHLIRLYVDQC